MEICPLINKQCIKEQCKWYSNISFDCIVIGINKTLRDIESNISSVDTNTSSVESKLDDIKDLLNDR